MSTFTTRDGAILNYRLQGRNTGRPPLFFIHGWCSNLHHWDPQAGYFSRKHKVLRIDRRGHGRSTTPGTGHSVKQQAADFAGVAHKAQIRNAIVVCHAGGAPAALAFAGEYPQLVKAVVAINAGLYPRARIGAPDSRFGMLVASILAGLDGPDPEQALRGVYRGFLGPNADPALVKRVLDDAAATPLAVAIAELKSVCVSTLGLARKVKQPVLYVSAEPIDYRHVASHFKDVQFAQPVGTGRFMHLEVPAQFNAMVETFIGQL
jgi:pimeloyl-ACP methyl ester carboxylesterase